MTGESGFTKVKGSTCGESGAPDVLAIHPKAKVIKSRLPNIPGTPLQGHDFPTKHTTPNTTPCTASLSTTSSILQFSYSEWVQSIVNIYSREPELPGTCNYNRHRGLAFTAWNYHRYSGPIAFPFLLQFQAFVTFALLLHRCSSSI